MAERTSHIHRIYQDDDQESEVWIDIERIDGLEFTEKRDFEWKNTFWRFDWSSFDPDASDGSVTRKKIFSPDDKDTYIEVPVRNGIETLSGSGYKWRNIFHYFNNGPSNDTRRGHYRRIVHFDISDESLDDDGQPPRDPDDYLNCLGDHDDDNYVRVEVIDSYFSLQGRTAIWQEKSWQIDATNDPLLRDPLDEHEIDFSYVGEDDQDGDGGIDPPWRIDPLQNIVNVSWGTGLAVIFGPKSDDAPKQDKQDQ